ncbi:MAG: hypothetical protein JXR76_05780 [Deltaproteobacteria bacterium]|nr:hypothetical protein [Deltaproteobacteria bacterium]
MIIKQYRLRNSIGLPSLSILARGAALSLLALSLMTVAVACDDDNKKSGCKVKADCGDGMMCLNSKCIPLSDTASTDTTGDTGSDSLVDGSDSNTADSADTGTDTASLGCHANSECDDGNPCTADFCNLTVSSPGVCDTDGYADDKSCDDSDPCNGNDVCKSAVCVHQSPPCQDIPDDSGCGTRVATCVAGAAGPTCQYVLQVAADGVTCMDGTPCAQGTCASGVCTGAQNVCGVSDGCTYYTCRATGTTIDAYECSSVTNDTDSACTK